MAQIDQRKNSFMTSSPSIFIEQVKGYKSLNLFNNSDRENKGWKPVLTCKKLYSQPKFIMSLQRKKARIISGIRDRQVQPQQQKMIGLVGSKVKNFRKPRKRNSVNISEQTQKFIKINQDSLLKNEFKRRKIPNMNFSLMYISERKKNIKLQVKNRDNRGKSEVSRIQTASFRQKGSDYPYFHMFMNQSGIKKTKPRPRTSCYSQRYQKVQQTKSEIL